MASNKEIEPKLTRSATEPLNSSSTKQSNPSTPNGSISKVQTDSLTAQELGRPSDEANAEAKSSTTQDRQKEIGGPKGLEPTRYGDWEAKGRCYDF